LRPGRAEPSAAMDRGLVSRSGVCSRSRPPLLSGSFGPRGGVLMAGKPRKPELRRALLEIVHNQLRDGDPPETRATLERLIGEGFTRERALELIACAVTSEVVDVYNSGQPYDEARYLAALRALPRLPWEGKE